MDSERNRYKYIFCGLMSGMLTKTACAPFDRIRLLYQVQPMFANKVGRGNNRKYKGILNTAHVILREEGVVGLWRGNMINTVRGGVCYATKFGVTDITRELLDGIDKNGSPGSFNSVIAGAVAGLIQKSISYPLDVVSVRMALGINTSNLNKECTYRGIFNCVSQIYNREGLCGFFKGFAPTICTGIPYIALQMGLFDFYKRKFKSILEPVESDENLWSNVKNLAIISSLSGSLSGFSALLIVFPGDTVRKRMMNNAISNQNRLYKNSLDCFRTILRSEGVLAYYHGLFPSLLKSIPSGAIQFVSYEIFKHIIL
ncbi:Mitochondrial transporter (putative) [Babesia microti strain RI]|uniref:Mitochondrial transporter (Putative) n=1 Tax=Babesia microti (strain RI) TaxID=1133968 RepID=A0A1N6LXX9_BABMR|nr:Mitochondrial transporter (putative) [Babesia microti strain RI]SIO73723.1 Mitochondrial transporter (putative) [Babesia microti strain RI]|eukprot:XP_021337789.1 Mitochondrial transporter (putative) [Babesia microti strain RI]